MNKDQVLEVLENALNVAVGKGVYNLQDAATIFAVLQDVKNTYEGYKNFMHPTEVAIPYPDTEIKNNK